MAKRYSEFPSDSVSKESGDGKGMKNVDARMGGAEYNTDHASGIPAMPVVVDPNANVSALAHQEGVEGGH